MRLYAHVRPMLKLVFGPVKWAILRTVRIRRHRILAVQPWDIRAAGSPAQFAVTGENIVGTVHGSPAYAGRILRGQWDANDGPQFLPLSPGRAYACGAFTEPGYRGRGLCGAAFAFLAPHLADVSELICRIPVGNEVSMRVHERMGFREIARYWEIWTRWRSFVFLPRWLPEYLASVDTLDL